MGTKEGAKKCAKRERVSIEVFLVAACCKRYVAIIKYLQSKQHLVFILIALLYK